MPTFDLYGHPVALPWNVPAAPCSGAPEIEVVLGEETTQPELEGEPLARRIIQDRVFVEAVATPDGGAVLRIPDHVDFELDASLARATVRPVGEQDEELISMLATGHLLSTLLGLRGELVLHSSAVVLGGTTIAATGPSNAGKTTIAGLLALRGAEVLCDDAARLVPSRSGDGWWLHPGCGELRLRPRAAEIAAHAPTLQTRETVDGRVALQTPPVADAHRLDVLVAPRLTADGDELVVRRLSSSEAFTAVLSGLRVGSWLRQREQRLALDHAASLAGDVPVIEVRLASPEGFTPGLAERLHDALAPHLPG